MLSNANITALNKANGASAAGNRTFAATLDLDARCAVDVPTMMQRRMLGATIEDATATLFVLKSQLPASVEIDDGDQVMVTVDGGTGRLHEVIHAINRQKSGGLAHFECYLKVVITA